MSVLEFEGGAIGVSETGFVTSGNGYFLELSGTQGSLHVFGDHGDRLEYSCPETGGKTVEMNDLPQPCLLYTSHPRKGRKHGRFPL